MGEGSNISWTDDTANPVVGCTRVSTECDNCLDPRTLVLMADMSWLPIENVAVGDRVVSFTDQPKHGANRVYEVGTVTAVWETNKPAVELTVGDRTVVASEDHKFLSPVRPNWREAASLALHNKIVGFPMVFTPDVDTLAYLSGYFAAVFAGDGTFRIAGSGKNGTKQSYGRVAVLESDRPVLERLQRWFQLSGIEPPPIRPFSSGAEGKPMSKVETRSRPVLVKMEPVLLRRKTTNSEWSAGWLAGALDTDGSYSAHNLRFHQAKDNDFLSTTMLCLDHFGFDYVFEPRNTSRVVDNVRVKGSVTDKLRLTAIIQPALSRKSADFEGRRFPSTQGLPVNGIRRVGERQLIDITVDKGTFIAEGLAAHNCYAEHLAAGSRLAQFPQYEGVAVLVNGRGEWTGRINEHPKALEVYLRKRKPKKVFVASMSDVFHSDIPVDYLKWMFETMGRAHIAHGHVFQVLTKRPQLVRRRLGPEGVGWFGPKSRALPYVKGAAIGTSIGVDRYTFRAQQIVDSPNWLPWLSIEPLLEPLPSLDLTGIRWVVVGGESGEGHRPMKIEWVEPIRVQCERLGIPFFFKQTGTSLAREWGLKSRAGADQSELPAEWRIHNFPKEMIL